MIITKQQINNKLPIGWQCSRIDNIYIILVKDGVDLPVRHGFDPEKFTSVMLREIRSMDGQSRDDVEASVRTLIQTVRKKITTALSIAIQEHEQEPVTTFKEFRSSVVEDIEKGNIEAAITMITDRFGN